MAISCRPAARTGSATGGAATPGQPVPGLTSDQFLILPNLLLGGRLQAARSPADVPDVLRDPDRS